MRDASQPYLAPLEYRAFPWLAFPHKPIDRPPEADLPPLIRGYLRAGALVCGEPAWDPEFSTADFLMLIAVDNVSGRYARHLALAHDGAPSRSASPRP